MANLAIAGYRRLTLLAPVTIAAAVAGVATTPATELIGMQALTAQFVFLYGAGGTTAKAWLQTSFDGGITWMDIASFAATTAALTRIFSVRSATAVAANVTPGDAVLADNTLVDGLLGDRLRVKYTTTGTYTGLTSLAVYALTRGA